MEEHHDMQVIRHMGVQRALDHIKRAIDGVAYGAMSGNTCNPVRSAN